MKWHLKDQLRENSGSASVGVVILILFIISVGLVLLSEVSGTILLAKKQTKNVVAQSLAEAGIEKAVWKINKNSGYTGESDLVLPTGTIDIAVNNIDAESKIIIATGYVPNKIRPASTRKVRVKIKTDPNTTNASFHYGVQVGSLGLSMSNNTKIIGNVYADGSIQGGSNNSIITGDAFVSGSNNVIDHVTVGGNAKGHTISSSTIAKDAYYQNIQNTTVGGIKYPGSPDPAPVGLPLSQQTIDQWESWAESGGVYVGDYNVTGSAGLGPKKIDGDLIINTGIGNTLTVNGTIWVTGDIIVLNNSSIKLNPSYGTNGGVIIADSPTDKANKGKINVNNNVLIQGSGNPKSSMMFVSTNNSSSITNPAIIAGNNSDAVIYYSTVGMVSVSNNVKVRAVSGGGLHLQNGAIVEYLSGMADSNFSGGPGGSWKIVEWQVVR